MSTSSTNTNAGRKWPWILVVALAGVAVLAGLTALVNSRNLEFERARADALNAEKLELQEQSAGLRERLQVLEVEMQAIAQTGNQSAEAALRRQRELESARSKEVATLDRYQQTLEEARSHHEELSRKVVSLEREVADLQSEAERLRRSESDLQSQMESAMRLTAALREQLQSKEKTLASLERAYQRYKDSNQESSRQLEAVTSTIADMEELNRRRLRLLEQGTRKAREISENFRTMAVRIDSDSRGQSGMSAEITRLQSAALALEDQIAQINDLNAQATRLERRLEQARNAN